MLQTTVYRTNNFQANATHVCCCRVFNPTDRTIELPAKAVVAMATPVEIVQQEENQQSVEENTEISVSEMRRVLEEKQVSFKDCAFTGKDFDALVRLLYRHRDRLAVKQTDLEVSDLLELRIDTERRTATTRPAI
jgi:hypothetical protein